LFGVRQVVTDLEPTFCSGHSGGIGFGIVEPLWHEVVDVSVGMRLNDTGDDVGEVGLRIDAVEFAGLDE
jgi:hypothetical protein